MSFNKIPFDLAKRNIREIKLKKVGFLGKMTDYRAALCGLARKIARVLMIAKVAFFSKNDRNRT